MMTVIVTALKTLSFGCHFKTKSRHVIEFIGSSQSHVYTRCAYLGNDSLSGAIEFVEEVVSLDEELASVFLFRRCPLSPQNNRTMGALLLPRHTVHILYPKKKKQDQTEGRWSGDTLPYLKGSTRSSV